MFCSKYDCHYESIRLPNRVVTVKISFIKKLKQPESLDKMVKASKFRFQSQVSK